MCIMISLCHDTMISVYLFLCLVDRISVLTIKQLSSSSSSTSSSTHISREQACVRVKKASKRTKNACIKKTRDVMEAVAPLIRFEYLSADALCMTHYIGILRQQGMDIDAYKQL
jgi:hypothetical protein